MSREAPTLVLSTRFYLGPVLIKIRKEPEQISVEIPWVEVNLYDKLMQTARASNQASLTNAVLAFLIAHGGGTKTVITGFLKATGFPDVSPDAVKQTLSKLRREKIICRRSAVFIVTRYYPNRIFGENAKVVTSQILGEPVYGIPEAIRMQILERLKIEPQLAWWQTDILKPKSIIKPVEYEWVKFIKPVPKIRSEEDFKNYGPYKENDIAKLPVVLSYYLVRKGFAVWLNPNKESVREIEDLFLFRPIEKIKRQAMLTEF
jgi:hypothetical protein